jgi:phosphoglycolate phosphatase
MAAVSSLMSAPRYKMVIFDFDGTLADSGDWFLSISDELADRFRFRRVPPDEIEMLRGQSSREVIRYLRVPRWRLPAIGRFVHARLAEQTDRIALFDGVVPMIEALVAAGVRLALVTSNSKHNARAILGPRITDHIEHFECGASLFGKAPRYRKVLRRAKLNTDEVFSIGDETRDIAAAHKVGIKAGAVMWGYANRVALARLSPEAMFETPDAVLDLVLGRHPDPATAG